MSNTGILTFLDGMFCFHCRPPGALHPPDILHARGQAAGSRERLFGLGGHDADPHHQGRLERGRELAPGPSAASADNTWAA